MTRYFVAANLWFVVGLVLLVGHESTDGIVGQRYKIRVFGSAGVDPPFFWAGVLGTFALAAACLAAGFRSRDRAEKQPRRSSADRPSMVPRVLAGCGLVALIPFALFALPFGLSKQRGTGPGPGVAGYAMFACIGVVFLALLGWLVRVVVGSRARQPARPASDGPSLPPQYFAGCALMILIPLGIFLVGLVIPAWQKMQQSAHPPNWGEHLVLGCGVALYVLILWRLFRVLNRPPATLPAPKSAPVVGQPAAPVAPRPCPKCGQVIASGSPQGLCPRCLLQGAFESAPKQSPTLAFVEAYVAPPVEEVAKLFPQLEVVRLIGQGGMGAVYLVRQAALDRLVALKLIRPRADDPTFTERFVREAKAMARLSHPNIVTVYDSGEAGGLPYLLMEHVDGVTLRDAMREKTLTPAEALAVIPQICDALEYAHRQGVVHRDIKPENILLTAERGSRGAERTAEGPGSDRSAFRVPRSALLAKIADFGLAKVVDPTGVSLTRTDQAMGTPHYMAPEQWEKPAEVDHRADIYALGVVLYELLTGELPLGRFDPPSQKVRLDIRLDEVVLRALAKEPNRRYQHASQVKTDLEQIRTGSGGWVRTPSFREYRSKATLLGWPLVHVVGGIDPATGRPKTAKGWLAIGDARAVGGIAIAGGGATGVLALAGGYAVGLLALAGGFAAGLLALAGGAAVGGTLAGGGGAAAAAGLAVAGGAAAGKFALAGGAGGGEHVFAANRRDPDFAGDLWDWLKACEIDPTDW